MNVGHNGQDSRLGKDLRMSLVSPVLPGRPSFDQLPEKIRCGLPPNVAVALDSRAGRNILRALHGGGVPAKLTVGELEADQRIEASAVDVRVLSSSLRVDLIRHYSREVLSAPLLKRRLPENALACVSFHTLLLVDCGLLTQVSVRRRGCTVEHFYAICDDCDLATDPRIDALLRESRAEGTA